jgi:hypothetical protein
VAHWIGMPTTIDRELSCPPLQPMGIGVTVARLSLNQLVKVRILDPQFTEPLTFHVGGSVLHGAPM